MLTGHTQIGVWSAHESAPCQRVRRLEVPLQLHDRMTLCLSLVESFDLLVGLERYRIVPLLTEQPRNEFKVLERPQRFLDSEPIEVKRSDHFAAADILVLQRAFDRSQPDERGPKRFDRFDVSGAGLCALIPQLLKGVH